MSDVLPNCMMPDGEQACPAYAAMVADRNALRSRLEAAESALNVRRNFYVSFLYPLCIALAAREEKTVNSKSLFDVFREITEQHVANLKADPTLAARLDADPLAAMEYARTLETDHFEPTDWVPAPEVRHDEPGDDIP